MMMNSIDHHQFRFYKINYSNISPEEVRKHSQSSDNVNPWLLGLFGMAIGVGVGYFIKQDQQEVPKTNETGVEKVARKSKSVYELFEEFADITETNSDGKTEKMMSIDGFIKSLVSSRPDVPSWVALPRRNGKLLVDEKRANDSQLKMIFDYADTDKNGMISYNEYALFMTFMTSSEHQLKIAFQCFDLDGSGNIEAAEFQEIVKASRARVESKARAMDDINWKKNGLMIHLFGPELDQKLSFSDFMGFIKSCKEVLLRQEFLQYDVEGGGLISVEAFSELMTKSVHYNSTNIPQFKRQLNLLKTRGFFAPSGRIDYETFKAFNDMAVHMDDIGIAIQLYTASRNGMKRDEFKSTVGRVAGIKITDRVADLIYAIYDKNGDGLLEFDEFMSTLQARKEIVN